MKPIDERLLAFMLEHPPEQTARAAGLYGEVQRLRLSFQRMHRRCQRAEAAAAGKLHHAEPKRFGRGLMAWAYAEERKRNAELEAALRRRLKTLGESYDLRAENEKLARYCSALEDQLDSIGLQKAQHVAGLSSPNERRTSHLDENARLAQQS